MNGSKFYCIQLARAHPGFSVWDTGPQGGCQHAIFPNFQKIKNMMIRVGGVSGIGQVVND